MVILYPYGTDDQRSAVIISRIIVSFALARGIEQTVVIQLRRLKCWRRTRPSRKCPRRAHAYCTASTIVGVHFETCNAPALKKRLRLGLHLTTRRTVRKTRARVLPPWTTFMTATCQVILRVTVLSKTIKCDQRRQRTRRHRWRGQMERYAGAACHVRILQMVHWSDHW